MENPSTKNLKGLFNLVRKESKDARKEIEGLERRVLALVARVVENEDGRRGENGEILECLRRIEGLLRGKMGKREDVAERSGLEGLRDREFALLRALVRRDGENSMVGNEQDSPVEGSGAEGDACEGWTRVLDTDTGSRDGGTSSVDESTTMPNFFETSSPVRVNCPTEHFTPSDDVQESKAFARVSGDIIKSPDDRTQKRLDAMSSQIEDLRQGQTQILALLRGLTVGKETEERKGPVIVPPPRKVERKVIGFVYEDENQVEETREA
jgi:hypothetical protein